MDSIWIMLTGILVAVNCSLLGVFLLLRKMTMIGDAIAHAVLPGIVLAYFVTQSKGGVVVLAGAALFGIITTLLIELFHKQLRLQTDAAIGMVFTVLFSVGVILISLFANQVELDQECVLYGEIAYVGLDTWYDVPRSIWLLGGLLIVVVNFVIFGYRPLWASTFDATFATLTGVSVLFWHYALMSLVSVTTVFAFESVGAILVVAFLIGPAATAYLVAKNLKQMLLGAVLAGLGAVIGGFYLAVWCNSSLAASMATFVGIEFLAVLLFKKIRMASATSAV
ncbi:MAG: metal ABC transporter permease [Cytophagales bacterium]|nr:MAG: metal ABC transporter permease [Cytophagales bacterium]